ncbi:MAG: PCMD domain-containing protein [Bacteroidales bacterium]
MKKKLVGLMMLSCIVCSTVSCSDDEQIILPPTIADVIKEYKNENLSVSLNGETLQTEGTLEVLQDEAGNVSVKLINILPDAAEFLLPEATFDVMTKAYISKLTAETTDLTYGYKVKVECLVEGDVMNVSIETEAVEETTVDASSIFNKMFKGKMIINDPLSGMEVESEQRIYFYKANGVGQEQKMRVLIKNFDFGGINIGNISLDTISLMKRSEDIYAFEAKDRKLNLPIIDPSSPIEVAIQLKGILVYTGEPKELDMTLDVVVPDLPAPVKVKFYGEVTVESTTATITSLALSGNEEVIIDPLTTKNPYSFRVWDDTDPSQLVFTPQIEVSDKASVKSVVAKFGTETKEYKAGEAIDFSKMTNAATDYVEIIIAAEDPNSTRAYKLKMERLVAQSETKFVFDGEWGNNGQTGGNFFEEPAGWASSNTAAMFLNSMGMYPAGTPYPITRQGKYAKIISVDTQGAFVFTVVPAVTAGSLFLGKFEVDIMNTLKSTKFGLPYRNKPVSLKGRIQYTAGAEYFRTQVDGQTVTKVPVPGKVDKASVCGVLYEVSNFDETLTGLDAYTSDKVVALAKHEIENTDGFADFSLNFTYIKDFDPAKKYKFAIICSSSAEGDKFEGAPGSELLIESLEIVNE